MEMTKKQAELIAEKAILSAEKFGFPLPTKKKNGKKKKISK